MKIGCDAMDRRDFLKTSLSAGAAFNVIPSFGARQEKKYRTALIGTGWWGMNILQTALASGTIKAIAMCDVDTNQLDPARALIEEKTGTAPKGYADYRELLEKEKPEIVIVATPDHWHALICIAAVKSGAHVYVEKPISHTLLEGKAMVHATQESGVKVQVGTHRRVSPHNISAMEFLKSGKVGKIGMVRSFVHYPGGAGEKTSDSEPPKGLDWNMWCGPAPIRPFNKTLHPKGFRQYLDYANGQLGDWGIHWLDQILWWTDEKAPKRISSTGGRFIKQDSSDAPDTQVATFEFESFVATWEHRMYAGNEAEKTNIGCYFYGTEGTFHLGWLDGWTFYPSNRGKPTVHADPNLNAPDQQNIRELWADFIESIAKNRKPVCDIETGHRSTSMALLGMIALKTGKTVHWDGKNERILNDVQSAKHLSRSYRAPWKYPK